MFKGQCTLVEICRLGVRGSAFWAHVSSTQCQVEKLACLGAAVGQCFGITRSLGGKEALMVSKARLKGTGSGRRVALLPGWGGPDLPCDQKAHPLCQRSQDGRREACGCF